MKEQKLVWHLEVEQKLEYLSIIVWLLYYSLKVTITFHCSFLSLSLNRTCPSLIKVNGLQLLKLWSWHLWIKDCKPSRVSRLIRLVFKSEEGKVDQN